MWSSLSVEKKIEMSLLLEKFWDDVDCRDEFGRSQSQRTEDKANPCRCGLPEPSESSNKTCCANCGFWLDEVALVEMQLILADDKIEGWCQYCREHFKGMKRHNKTCVDFLYYQDHCDECDKLKPGLSYSDLASKMCRCAAEQDTLNDMDQPYCRR